MKKIKLGRGGKRRRKETSAERNDEKMSNKNRKISFFHYIQEQKALINSEAGGPKRMGRRKMEAEKEGRKRGQEKEGDDERIDSNWHNLHKNHHTIRNQLKIPRNFWLTK